MSAAFLSAFLLLVQKTPNYSSNLRKYTRFPVLGQKLNDEKGDRTIKERGFWKPEYEMFGGRSCLTPPNESRITRDKQTLEVITYPHYPSIHVIRPQVSVCVYLSVSECYEFANLHLSLACFLAHKHIHTCGSCRLSAFLPPCLHHQFRPHLNCFEESEKYVCVDCALVRLVNHHHL